MSLFEHYIKKKKHNFLPKKFSKYDFLIEQVCKSDFLP